MSYQTPESWGETKITPLQDPIGEFNARGGMELAEYLAFQEHLTTEHPGLGQEQWAEVQGKLPPIELIEDPNTKQSLRVQRFNWPKDGQDVGEQVVTTFNLPFSVPIDLDHLVYQHYLLAEAIGTPLMVIENPGYGDSDKLTPTQKADLKERADFSSVADTMLGIAESLGVEKMNCVGYSMGSDTAAAMAARADEHVIEVENLFIMESPRVVKQNPLKLGKNFAGDAKNLKFTWQHPVDPVLREVAELKPGLPKGLTSYGRALYKGGLQSDIESALRTQPDMKVTVASAGSSKISPQSANNDMIGNLRFEFAGRKIRQIVVPGESHAYGDSGRRYADLARLVLR